LIDFIIRMRTICLLVAALFGISCYVPPSCFDRTFHPSAPEHKYFVGVRVYAGPIAEPKRRYSTGIGMWERFERGDSMEIAAGGTMAVGTLHPRPRTCPRVAREEVVELSRIWDTILEPLRRRENFLMVMPGNPYTWKDEWRPDGPLVEVSVVSPSGKNLGLMWDGRTRLSKSLDDAVMGTLEVFCSNSRLAERYLRRDLPQETSSRLQCKRK
jgi:hypothetical protein